MKWTERLSPLHEAKPLPETHDCIYLVWVNLHSDHFIWYRNAWIPLTFSFFPEIIHGDLVGLRSVTCLTHIIQMFFEGKNIKWFLSSSWYHLWAWTYCAHSPICAKCIGRKKPIEEMCDRTQVMCQICIELSYGILTMPQSGISNEMKEN